MNSLNSQTPNKNFEILSFIYSQQLHHAIPKKKENTVLLLLFLEEKQLVLYADEMIINCGLKSNQRNYVLIVRKTSL